MRRSTRWVLALLTLTLAAGMAARLATRMGRQPDGGFLVSSGQRVEGGAVAFDGRPSDLAIHPSGAFYAVLNKSAVLLGDDRGTWPEGSARLGGNAAYRGLGWSPDGTRLLASCADGSIRAFLLVGRALKANGRIAVDKPGTKGNPVPGGFCLDADGKRLFVAAANRNAVVEVDLATRAHVREYPVQNLPFEVKLTADGRTLVASNWGGRPPMPGEPSAKSLDTSILVDDRGVPASGTVSLIDLVSGATRHVAVGRHPSAIALDGDRAFVANALDDTVSVVDITRGEVARTIELRYDDLRIFGAMPDALAVAGDTLYVADGGDNAVAEVDIPSGRVRGYRPAGYFPVAIALSKDTKRAYVLNSKGNGSVARTTLGKPGNAHDFQGTVSVVDLAADLESTTAVVARNNRWDVRPSNPKLKVYDGAIKHVIYIIKENRTYDEVFGDLPIGDGDPKLCSLGETVMPNHRAIARQFTLFDNGHVSGTNSADGHAWSNQCLANDYLEHFYVGYSRTYPDDGTDAMALSPGGALWDAALRAGKAVRVYGEYTDPARATITPKPKDWFEVWEDRKNGGGKFTFAATTAVASLKPLIHPGYLYWPLWQSDQQRGDIFIKEYEQFSKADAVPNLMVLSLPCDHGEGVDPRYPTPRAMMADNDLALGRIVEAVSKSPQWAETCVFVVEDDAQSGPDHVDGHRSVFMAISPYNRRGAVDSTFYVQPNMFKSMELMLGLKPLNRFDALADPMAACFGDDLDITPYKAVPNNVPLDERNPAGRAMNDADRFWLAKTRELDWSHVDAPDPYWLNRINWYSLFKGARPYPARPGEEPGAAGADD